jgi:hypothetical protein
MRLPDRFALSIITLVFAACGGGSDGTGPAAVPANTVGTAGGTVSLQGGVVQLVVPPGALASNQTFSATPVADTVGDLNVVADRVYKFEPSGITFAQPVEMKLSFNPASLPPGAPVSSVRLRKLVDGAWQPVATDVVVDSATNTVRGKVSGFSQWSVYADPCVPEAQSLSLYTTLHAGSCSLGDLGLGALMEFGMPVTTRTYTWTMTGSGTGAFRFGLGQAATPFSARNVIARVVQNPGAAPVTLQAILPGGPFYLFASRVDTTVKANVVHANVSYDTTAFSRNQATSATGCGGKYLYVIKGVSVDAHLDANDCNFGILYTDDPSLLGKRIYADVYYVVLPPGVPLSATVSLPAPPPGAPPPDRGQHFTLSAYTDVLLTHAVGDGESKTIYVPASGETRIVAVEVSHMADVLPSGGFAYSVTVQ